MSSLLRRRKGHGQHVAKPEPLIIPRSGSLRPAEALSPLKEGPDQDDGGDSRMEGKWGQWMKGQLSRGGPSSVVSSSSNACNNTSKRSDLRLLLGVLGAPLAPVHVSTAEPLPHLSIKDTPIVSPFSAIFLCVSFYTELFDCLKITQKISFFFLDFCYFFNWFSALIYFTVMSLLQLSKVTVFLCKKLIPLMKC
jgi:hypothetical protein